MSWDGIIFQAPPDVSVEELPDNFEMPLLGTTEEISQKLISLLPEAKHCVGQCTLSGEDFWLELNFGFPPEEEFRNSIGVRSNAGLGVIPILKIICDCFSARLFDIQINNFADMQYETELSMQKFSEWRYRALQAKPDQAKP